MLSLSIIAIVLSIISIAINIYTLVRIVKRKKHPTVSYRELYNYRNQKVKIKK